MNYYEIGQKIRKYRKANQYSQEQLAELVGISVTHMSHIETGNTKLSLSVLVRLSEVLEIQTDDLLREKYAGRQAESEAIKILEQCNPRQLRIITDLIRTAKISLDKYS